MDSLEVGLWCTGAVLVFVVGLRRRHCESVSGAEALVLCIPGPALGAWLGGATAGLIAWNVALAYFLLPDRRGGYVLDSFATLNISILICCLGAGRIEQLRAQRAGIARHGLESVAPGVAAPASPRASTGSDDVASLDRGDNPEWRREMDAATSTMRERRYPVAFQHLERALHATEKLAPGDPRRGMSLLAIGYWYYQQQRHAEAETSWRHALTLLESLDPHEPSNRTRMWSDLGNCLLHLRKYAESERLMRRARARYAERLGESHRYVSEIDGNLTVLRQTIAADPGAPRSR